MSTTAARNFLKNDHRGNGKKGKPSSKQQSTTQIGCVSQGEGAQGSRRMAIAARGIKAEGEGDW